MQQQKQLYKSSFVAHYDQDCWHTILAYSRLKVLAVNGASHPADVGHRLA